MKKILLLIAVVLFVSCNKEKELGQTPSIIKELTLENMELRELVNRYRQLYGILPDIDTNEEFGIWKIGNYVDEFKEPTGRGFVYTEVNGTFSNSATTDANLLARLVIAEDDFRILLYEYARNHPIHGEGILEFKAKRSDGKSIEFKTYNGSDGNNELRDYDVTKKQIIDFINDGQVVKFYAKTLSSYTESTYRFTIPCGAKLLEALNKTNGQ